MTTPRRRKPRSRNPADPTWEEREHAYRRQRVIDLGSSITPNQIARRLGMDDGQVRRILKAAGIEPREEPKWYSSGR